MPTIRYQGREAVCAAGTRLRDALLDAGMTPHHPAMTVLNCSGRQMELRRAVARRKRTYGEVVGGVNGVLAEPILVDYICVGVY